MTASEFAFLALGLVLGVAVGAALVEIVRSRPPAPREVRLTVAPDSIPRRARTLASASLDVATSAPAPGGPADRRAFDRDGEAPGTQRAARAPYRTDVRSPIGAPVGRPLALAGAVAGAAGPPTGGGLAPTAFPERLPSSVPRLGDDRGLVGIAIRPEHDDALDGLRADGRRPSFALASSAGHPSAADPAAPRGSLADDGALRRPGREAGRPTGRRAPALAAHPTPATDACADLRRAAEERCSAAERLALQAETARVSLREAQRACDVHEARAAEAAALADPRAIREAKEAAQRAFRSARSAAASREALEAAARTWLGEINQINQAAREATTVRRREATAAEALLTQIERLSLEADAARITAETAREACLEARQALASCEERAARAAAEPVGQSVALGPPPDIAAPMAAVAEREGVPGARVLTIDATVGDARPAVFRLLQGERATMQRLVAALAGDDPAERRRWQLQLSDLIDALFARAIEAAALDFPADHPFWHLFTLPEARDITAALASLGYRFDGLGGFLDGRIPGQRDLSLAVGYTGLDPMRVRRWPSEAEMPELFRDVTVAADEYLAGAAPALTLGELVTLLGRRADGLTDVWNAWGRVRPLLLDTSA